MLSGSHPVNRRGAGEEYFHRAEKYRKSAAYSAAIELYKRALAVYKKGSDITGTLNCFLALADTLRAKGEFVKARSVYTEGLGIAEALDDRASVADALVGLGLSVRALGDWHEAMNMVNKANPLKMSLRLASD